MIETMDAKLSIVIAIFFISVIVIPYMVYVVLNHDVPLSRRANFQRCCSGALLAILICAGGDASRYGTSFAEWGFFTYVPLFLIFFGLMFAMNLLILRRKLRESASND